MSPVLPLELDEFILELVLDDSRYGTMHTNLRQCALVCRAWRPKSQALLFRKLTFDHWISGDQKLYDYRRFLEEHPHLLHHLRCFEFWMPHKRSPCRSVYGLLFHVLATRLPALRTMLIYGANASFELHRFHSAPYVQMANIANLELSYIDIVDMTDFYHFILRFPNLSSLRIIDCYWKNSSRQTSPRLRKRWRAPAITQLSLAFGAAVADLDAIPQREDVEDYMPSAIQLLLRNLGANLVHLQINLRAFEFLTSPQHTPDTYELLRSCSMPSLRRLEVHLRCPARLVKSPLDDPYPVSIGRIPTLLNAIDATGLRVLGLYFSRVEVQKSEELFLDALEQIHGELSILVEGEHFPRLEKIRLDVGAPPHMHSWWNPRLAERLPVLAGRDLLEIVQHVTRWFKLYGPFTDPPGIGDKRFI